MNEDSTRVLWTWQRMNQMTVETNWIDLTIVDASPINFYAMERPFIAHCIRHGYLDYITTTLWWRGEG